MKKNIFNTLILICFTSILSFAAPSKYEECTPGVRVCTTTYTDDKGCRHTETHVSEVHSDCTSHHVSSTYEVDCPAPIEG